MSVDSGDAWVFGKPYRGRQRRRRSAILAAATAFFLIAGTAIAFADTTISDGDGVTPVANNNMALGTVCVGTTTTHAALIAINRNGNAGSTNVFKDGSTATISVLSTSGTGLSASMGSTTIAIPSNWGAQPNNTLTAAVSSTVSLTPTSTGSFSGSINYRATGINASNDAIDRDDPMTVSATVVSCDSTPPVITKVVTGTSGSNGWYTSTVQVAWTVTDAESAVVIDSGCGTQTFTSETTGTTSSCAAHSAGGSSSDSVSLKIDKTGPSAALAVTSGTLGSHGWYVSNVTISTSGSDPVSDNVACTADQHLNSDSTGTTFDGTCTNGAGLSTNAAPLTVKRDTTDPTITPSWTPAPNSDGWNKQASVTVSYTCADTTSDLDPAYGNDGSGCWLDDTATLEGLTSFVNRAVYDMAGNSASVSPDVRIDRTPPTINQGATTGTLGSNGWYTSDVGVDFTASDGLSGLKHPADASFTLTASGDGSAVSTGTKTVSDKADNDSTAGPLTFMIDKSDPLVSCDTPPSGWSGSDISIHCTAADGVSGLQDPGDADFYLSTSVANGTEDSNASTDGRNVCDLAGRCVQAGPFTGLKVDKKAPDLSCGTADGSWHAVDVTIGCTSSDGGSGLAVSGDASFGLSTSVAAGTEDANASTGSHQICDAVNNCVTAGPVGGNMIDKRAPDLSCGIADGLWHNADVTIPCTSTDGGSGLGSPADASFGLSTNVAAGTEDANASTGTHQVCDAVNNCATGGPVTGNMVDKKAPGILCESADGLWHNADVTVGCTSSDGGSGLAVSGDANFGLSTSVAAGTEDSDASTGSHQVCDAVSNCVTAGPIGGNMVDKKAPGILCGSPDGLWHNIDVTIGCTSTDGGSGLAVLADASFNLSTSVPANTEDPNASTGSHQVCDAVGNCATGGPLAGNMVDKKAPTVVCGSPDGLWHVADVSINCMATDAGSGPALATAALATTVTSGTETSNAATGIHSFCDAVGNCALAGPIGGNKVDKKAPSISITTPADGSSFVLGQVVNSVFGCGDGGSGVAACSGPASVDTSSVGGKAFTVNATDNVGNASSSTNNYSVLYSTGLCLGSPGHQVLQPVNADGSSAFKKGSTVPVKFRVCDANGNSIGTAGLVSSFKLVKTVTGAVEATVDETPVSTTPDSAFRWDPTDRQWIFNLNTKNLGGGITYFYRITLNDTSTIEFHFYLRS